MSKNVRIYRPSKNTMQSGLGKTRDWILEFELETRRAPEPLMGWSASGDTDNQVVLRFLSQEEAVKFAGDKGWSYTVEAPKERIVRPRNYMDNFRYIPPKDSAKT